VLDPSAETSMATLPALTAPVTLAIGPEGGLEGAEVATLIAAHFQPVRLGGNILRFETATIAALAIVRSMLDAQIPTARNVADLSLLQNR